MNTDMSVFLGNMSVFVGAMSVFNVQSVFMAPTVSVHGPRGQCSWSSCVHFSII